jgi:hypothetical protein
MPRLTEQEYQAYLSRRAPRQPLSGGGVSKESELHADIVDECKRRGWIAFHGSMAHQTFRTLGEPDFVILSDDGRVLLVECKTATGKLSPEQIAIHAWAAKLGHQVLVVRSMADFYAALTPSK